MAGSNPKSSSRFTGRLGAATTTHNHMPAAPFSVSSSMAQQVVGDSIQLADKPILGTAAMQPQVLERQTSNDCRRQAVQAAAATSADLNEATDRSWCCESVATSAATTGDVVGESYRSSDLASGVTVEADRAGNAVSRAASPPFFFEEDAGGESLVDLGGTWMAGAAPEPTQPLYQERTAGFSLEGNAQPQKAAAAAAVRDHHQHANTARSGLATQASSQRQQLGSSCAAADRGESQPIVLRGSQPATLCCKEQTQAVAHNAAAAAAILPLPVLRGASRKPFDARQAELSVDTAAPTRELAKHTASSQQAGVLVSTVCRDSGDKENEEVGMARVVRRVGDVRSRLDKQTVVPPTKPVTSSKVSGS